MTGEKVSQLSAGELFCYFPEQPLHYIADSADPWTFAWVGFTGKRAGEILRRSAAGTSPVIYSHPSPERMEGLFESLFWQQSSRKTGYDLISEGILLELLGELCTETRRFPAAEVSATSRYDDTGEGQTFYVEKMKQFIQSNYQNAITVQHVVDYIGIDRSYASRIFHRIENRTIQRYLIDLRMTRARQLLEEKSLSILNVARSVGYQDYATFERRFRQEAGFSPSAFPKA
ncbi:AraC family transcriptional regulator [Marispirochaeta sp.]|uniref:AraC family transcriptional regulator n=1 Tax=Marispirochaeta sp. TaxID=2038653 RepID=UPI0029C75C22|nr:AraC family transcriptional regulator [Marispirochaeta sp.]